MKVENIERAIILKREIFEVRQDIQRMKDQKNVTYYKTQTDSRFISIIFENLEFEPLKDLVINRLKNKRRRLHKRLKEIL